MEDYLDRLNDDRMNFYKNTYKNSEMWNGKIDISDKNIIIYCEQGLGDCIQFSRYFPLIKCKNLYLHCDLSLHKIFKQFTNNLIDKNDSNLPKHDYNILSLSLPSLLNDPLIENPYIKIEEKIDLSDFKNNLKIGIAWEGNPDHSNNNERSCELKHFKHLAKNNMKLFSLQKQFHNKELLKGSEDLELYSCEINDFYDTAKLINSLDVVVCVDTSVLHLAGAMGKICFGLLSQKHDPRWNMRKWYKNIKFIRGNNWNNILITSYIQCEKILNSLFP